MALYRYLLLTLAVPVLLLRFALQMLRGRMTRADLDQRLGGGPAPVARGPVLWLHAASVGEATAARPLAETLLVRDPRASLVVTTNSPTGRTAVAGWGLPRVAPRLAPIDTRWAVLRFLARWQPAALVTVENELWPNRFVTAKARRIPVTLAGARISARTAGLWRRFPGLARAVMENIDLCAAQDGDSEARFLSLGLPKPALGARLNLKSAVQMASVSDAELAPFAAALPYAETWLAASTHAGEEEPALDALAFASVRNPHVRLILAPRHPERGDEIATLIGARGLAFRRRSRGQLPEAGAQVYLADTLGEMPLWYNLAAVTFVGGSLVDKGGHTPFEPMLCDSAILHGPHTGNAPEAYAALAGARGAVQVTDGRTLGAEVLRLLGDPEARAAMAARARTALARAGTAEGVNGFADALGRLTGNPALARIKEH